MGNIVSGFMTGIFIYVTDEVLQVMKIDGALYSIIKFTVQGTLTYIFVKQIDKFSNN